MATEHIDFTFGVTFSGSVPEWAWGKNLYRGRISFDELRRAWTPAPPREPSEIFKALEGAIKEAAARMVLRSDGEFEEPMTVIAADV